MAYIGKKPEDAFRGLAYYDTFTGDGSTTTFDLSADAPDGGQNDITVVVDNVRQEPGASKSYTLGDDGSGRFRRVTFNTAPDNLSEIYVVNPGRSTQLNTVSDNAITAAKIQTDAVTTAKIQNSAVTNDKLAGSIANAKLANSSITINGNAVSLGGSITAGTDWQAVTVADGSTTLNAVAGKGYFLDTNAGVIEVFLPTSPTRGDTVILADYSGTFATNKVLVNTGGALIDSTEGGPGSSNDFELTTNNQVVELVYVDAAKGWLVQTNSTPSGLTAIVGGGGYGAEFISATGGTVTESGDFKIHTFTGDGCFVVSSLGNPAGGGSIVDYLVVAGGGSGGGGQSASDNTGGGGGAGGFRESKDSTLSSPHTASPLAATTGLTISTTTYPVTVGGGGAGVGCTSRGNNGSNSVFSTITSAGGGGGASAHPSPTRDGKDGGSGGGASGGTAPAAVGGAGNTPPVSPAQGFRGGNYCTTSPDHASPGGGGATDTGFDKPGGLCSVAGGPGGSGATTAISGTSTGYAGGGGGGAGVCGCVSNSTEFPNGRAASPGIAQCATAGFGGAPGGRSRAFGGGVGTANKGGGGGGGGGRSPAGPSDTSIYGSGAGGKGIVIIRYKFQ